MPIYEYACQDCGQQFETLVRSDTRAECPNCHSIDLQKQLSVFAAGKSAPQTPATPPGPCAGCGHAGGPGSCAFG